MSLVLGGRDVDGTDRYNELSEMCLIASTELSLIDPKINLRVDKETPLSRLALATELTRRGLGFPQYANDDVVIPGLLSLGYAPRDAYDYVVAACWEFIVPGCAFDIPNEGKVNFPLAASADACERVEGNRYHITKGEVTRHFAQFFPYATYEMTMTGEGEAGFRFHIPGADACVYLSEKTVILQIEGLQNECPFPASDERTLIVTCRPSAFDIYTKENGRARFVTSFDIPAFAESAKESVFTAGYAAFLARGRLPFFPSPPISTAAFPLPTCAPSAMKTVR